MRYMIIMLLLTSCAWLKEKPKFELISDQDLEREYKKYGDVAIELKEFKIGKKHCLWGSKDFDDKCQDAAMEYAYGDNWREFKKTALDFVKYIKEKNAKKLMTIFGWEYDKADIFFISIPNKNKDGSYIPGMGLSRNYFRLLCVKKLKEGKYYGFTKEEIARAKYIIAIPKQKPFFLDDPTELLEKYLNNIMQDLSKAINGVEYKDFLLEKKWGAYIINISKYMTIDFMQYYIYPEGKHTELYSLPKIDIICYF